MARSTVENTIERIRRQLNSSLRMEVNTLASSLTTSTDPITLNYELSNSIRPGAILSIGTELMRVIAVNRASKEINVLRGWQDTDAEAHDDDAEVLINPRFTRFDLWDSIILEIASWEPDLYTLSDDVESIAGDAEGFELASAYSNALGVVELRRNFTEDDSSVWPEFPFELHRGASANLTPTEGSGLFVRFTSNGGRARSAGTVLARVAIPYDTALITAESTDLITDVGLDTSLLELVELGVKYRVMMDDEMARSGRMVQDEPRRNDEVPVGAALTAAQFVLQRYERRRRQEVERLRTKYPFRAW